MKIKIATLLLLVTISNNLVSQQNKTLRTILDSYQVPKNVRAALYAKYPKANVMLWYSTHITYWYEDYAQTWYGDWYRERKIVYYNFGQPSYYVSCAGEI